MPSSGRTRARRASCPAHGGHVRQQSPKDARQSGQTLRPTKSHRTPSHQLVGAWGAQCDRARQTALPGDGARGRTGHAPRTDAPAPATRPPRDRPQRVPQRRNRHSIPRMWSPRRDRHAPQQMPSRLPLSPAKHNRSTAQQRAQTKKASRTATPRGRPDVKQTVPYASDFLA